eukprot:PhM_4_TR15922/c1_g1_i1/m.11346
MSLPHNNNNTDNKSNAGHGYKSSSQLKQHRPGAISTDNKTNNNNNNNNPPLPRPLTLTPRTLQLAQEEHDVIAEQELDPIRRSSSVIVDSELVRSFRFLPPSVMSPKCKNSNNNNNTELKSENDVVVSEGDDDDGDIEEDERPLNVESSTVTAESPQQQQQQPYQQNNKDTSTTRDEDIRAAMNSYDPRGLRLPTRDLLFWAIDGTMPVDVIVAYPGWARSMRVVQVITLLAIFASCIVLFVRTLPEYYNRDNSDLDVTEALLVFYFCTEYTVRFVLCRSRRRWATSWERIIDLMAIVPFFIQIVTQHVGSAYHSIGSAARMLRALGLLRVMKRSIVIRSLAYTITHSVEGMQLGAFIVFVCVSVFSTAMYYAEQNVCHFDTEELLWKYDKDNATSSFQSIPATMWWCVASLTTTGYGDSVPRSSLGKVVAGITMITSVFVLSFPTVILGANFQENLGRRRKVRDLVRRTIEAQKMQQSQNQQQQQQQQPTPTLLPSIFFN